MRGPLELAEALEVEHGLVHRHRDVVGRLAAHERGERVVVRDHGQIQRPHDDALVGDPQPHPPRQVVLGEQLVQRGRKRRRVGRLAIAQQARRQHRDGAAPDRDRSVCAHLCGGDVTWVEFEPDDGRRLLARALEDGHGDQIGRGTPRL